MELKDILVNGSGYDEEYNFHNQALTLIFKDHDREQTIRANLHYFPLENQWDLNPIFFEFYELEKNNLIQQILASHKVNTTFN